MSKTNFVCLGPHPPGRFYGPPVPPPGVHGAPAGPPVASVRGGRGRGHRGSGRCVTAGRGPHRVPGSRSRVRDDSNEETFMRMKMKDSKRWILIRIKPLVKTLLLSLLHLTLVESNSHSLQPLFPWIPLLHQRSNHHPPITSHLRLTLDHLVHLM